MLFRRILMLCGYWPEHVLPSPKESHLYHGRYKGRPLFSSRRPGRSLPYCLWYVERSKRQGIRNTGYKAEQDFLNAHSYRQASIYSDLKVRSKNKFLSLEWPPEWAAAYTCVLYYYLSVHMTAIQDVQSPSWERQSQLLTDQVELLRLCHQVRWSVYLCTAKYVTMSTHPDQDDEWSLLATRLWLSSEPVMNESTAFTTDT